MEKKNVHLSIDLPHDLYDDLVRQAGTGRRRVSAWILKKIQVHTRKQAPTAHPAASPLEKWFGIFKGGRHGSDNRRIDADIAREIAAPFPKRRRR